MIPLAYLDWPDDATTTTSTSTTTTTTSSTTTTTTTTGPTTTTTTAAPVAGIWYTYCGNVAAGYPPGTVVGPVFEAGGNCTTRFNQLNSMGEIGSNWNCAPGNSSGSSVAPADCPTPPPTTTTTGTTTTTAATTTTTTTTAAPCNCSQFDNLCPPGFSATCTSSCQFTGVCFG